MSPLKLIASAAVDSAAVESRRDFLKLLALSVGGSQLIGCARTPDDPIVSSVKDATDEDAPMFYASSLTRNGYADGVLVKTRYGHPIKIEGNPSHPASGGGTDIFSQAAIYALWDAQRAKAVQRRGTLSNWDEFARAMRARLAASHDGSAVRILSEPSTSPTQQQLRKQFAQQFPHAVWHTYSSLPRDNVYKGAQSAFGKALEPHYDFSRAAVVVSLDADFLTALPGAVRYARDFAARREPAKSTSPLRLYCIESVPTPASILADHRLALRPDELIEFAAALLASIDGKKEHADAPWQHWVGPITSDLVARRGAGIVVCGDHASPTLHHLAHALNARLDNIGKSVLFAEPLLDETEQLTSLQALRDAITAGAVESLFVLGGNPVYTAPADFEFGAILDRVPWSAHLGAYDDETSLHAIGTLPLAHELETWGDARAFDGTAIIAQPAIAPLHDGKSIIELLGEMLGASRERPRPRTRNVAQNIGRTVRVYMDAIAARWRCPRHERDDGFAARLSSHAFGHQRAVRRQTHSTPCSVRTHRSETARTRATRGCRNCRNHSHS